MISNTDGVTIIRYDTANNWQSANSVLAQGEIAIESNTGLVKVGDGSTTWNSLIYVNNTLCRGNATAQSIPANTDIDTITAVGVYGTGNNANVRTLTHAPSARAGVLEVFYTFSNSYLLQRWTEYLGNAVYQRAYYNSAWTSWYKFSGSAI